MNVKEKFKNNVLVDMRLHTDMTTIGILEDVLVKALQGLEITELETLPAAVDDTNRYIKELFMVRKAPKLSEKTVSYYLHTIDELVMTVNKPLLEMTECDIEYYLYGKRSSNTNRSLNNLKRVIKAFFTWMRKAKLVSENPCECIEDYEEIQKPVDHLEARQMELLKTGCMNDRDRALIEFMRCTAMRRGEIPLVKVSDVDFATGRILIYGEKTRKYRTVYLDNVALMYVQKYLDSRNVAAGSSEPLFTVMRGDKTNVLTADGIYRSIKTIAGRSDIDINVYPHVFRKTTATNIIRRGGSDDIAGEYLGHAPKSVTSRHYTYKDEKHIERIFHSYVEAI